MHKRYAEETDDAADNESARLKIASATSPFKDTGTSSKLDFSTASKNT
jgi:hypothetical protein